MADETNNRLDLSSVGTPSLENAINSATENNGGEVEAMEVEQEPSATAENISPSSSTTELSTPSGILMAEQRELETEASPVVNSTPLAAVRTVQLLSQPRDSPEEFKDNGLACKSSKRAKIAKSPLKSPEKEDDSTACPICFEPWSNSGSHRLASLSCGHLFGRSCIDRWLKSKGGNDKCPQCNAPAKRKDIRNIYAKTIKTIDTAEKDRALADLDKERELRRKAEQAEARALLQYQLVKAECERIKVHLQQQESQLVRQGPNACRCKQPITETRTHGESTSQLPTFTRSYVMQRSFQIATGGARVMSFDEHHALLIVSKPSPNQLFPGYGVVKVSSLDVKHCEFVRIHQKPIRDACFSCQGDGLLLTAGMDKTVKITSILSNTVVQTYSTPVPAWSCAWNNSDTNYMYCGLQNGSCLMFDVRNTSTSLKSLQSESAGCCPVVSLAHVTPSPDSKLKPGGILVGKLEGACFWESTFGVDYLPHTLTLPEGSCTSLSFEPVSRQCLFSLRPSKHFPKTRHVVCQLEGNGIGMATARGQSENDANSVNTAGSSTEGSLCTSSAVIQCVGGPVRKLLSRSALFSNPDDDRRLLVAAPDEGAKSTLLWDGSTGKHLQKLPDQGEPVLDLQPFAVNGSNFLTTITEQKLNIYKWQ